MTFGMLKIVTHSMIDKYKNCIHNKNYNIVFIIKIDILNINYKKWWGTLFILILLILCTNYPMYI